MPRQGPWSAGQFEPLGASLPFVFPEIWPISQYRDNPDNRDVVTGLEVRWEAGPRRQPAAGARLNTAMERWYLATTAMSLQSQLKESNTSLLLSSELYTSRARLVGAYHQNATDEICRSKWAKHGLYRQIYFHIVVYVILMYTIHRTSLTSC
jgi:hypothetical protein